MPKDPVLRSAAALLAYIYNDLVLCPLPEEYELLLNAGHEGAEDLLNTCRLVFGSNINHAIRKCCVYVANYCDSLVDHSDEFLKESNARMIIDDVNMKIAAIEYLAVHAPIDSSEERSILSSLAYQARICYGHLLKRYRTYMKSLHQNRA